MQIILEPYTIPERGTFLIHETVTIQVSADEARRQVDQWLLHEVNSQMGADQPTLVVGATSVWRVPVFWGAPHVGRVGMVGVVEVDVLSGTIHGSSQSKAELIQRVQDLVAELPPFQPREASATYLAQQVVATHQPGRPSGSPRDLLASPK